MTRFFCFLTIISSLLLSAVPARAEEDVSVTTYANFLSGYIFQGVPAKATGRPVFQYGATVTKGNWYADVWVSNDWDKSPFSNCGGCETDFTLGYSRSFWGVDWRISVAWFMLPEFDQARGDVIQTDLEASKTFKIDEQNSIRPYMLVEFNAVFRGPYDGTSIQTGVGHQWSRGNWTVSNQVGYTHYTVRGNHTVRYNGGVSYNWNGVSLDLLIVKAYYRLNHGSEFEAVFGAGVSKTF